MEWQSIEAADVLYHDGRHEEASRNGKAPNESHVDEVGWAEDQQTA